MGETLSIDFDQPLPLFPLKNCVLLPHATIPLHIFETRYRKMTQDALDSHRLIAMALFDENDWDEQYGNPPLRGHVCVGHIVQHAPLSDGRFHLLLQGICRAEIVDEVPNDPYRLAILRPTETHAVMEIDLGEQRVRIEQLLCDPMLKQLASVNAIHNWLSGEIPTAALVDLAIMTVCDDVEQRYGLLAESNVHHRARWLEKHLHLTRHSVKMAQRFGNGKSEEGINLN